MTPKILKAGLLVGALVFALVSCGQNTKPMADLPASYTFDHDGPQQDQALQDFRGNQGQGQRLAHAIELHVQAIRQRGSLWIQESKPTYIILNAATLPPAPRATSR